jgi:hypothetical protein
MNDAIRHRIDTLERRVWSRRGVDAMAKLFDELFDDGQVSQKTLDTGDPRGYFTAIFGLQKCDDGYWRMKATDKN